MSERSDQLRQQILQLTAEFHAEAFPRRDFVPGDSAVPVSGKVIDAADMSAVVDSALDGWFTTGRWAKEFERKLARFVGVRSASLVNSGSSANLVALSALTSPKLGARALKPGDEVITVAAGFPTTVNPIIQNRLHSGLSSTPMCRPTMPMSRCWRRHARTRPGGDVRPHPGQSFDLGAVKVFCDKHDLWLIEDCCDALGATYDGKPVGTFGDILPPSASIRPTISPWARAAR
jgi:CDP-6-deoxy-D-xylo-4-hexulose-3-dehydrase